ncbi:hypothetical protein GGI19_001913 [Coemansia pectinata]|uniref:Uncharacterized protein n=1 Tax=Coemansia pectinata TaxID=1052879 RepID=A0A9W8H3B8_9FUNG|nr:hypothetical protein GGI19_001913 [Coemansia pectinata]
MDVVDGPVDKPSNSPDRERATVDMDTDTDEYADFIETTMAATHDRFRSKNFAKNYHDELDNKKLVDIYSGATTWSLKRDVKKNDMPILGNPPLAPAARTVARFSGNKVRYTASALATPSASTGAYPSGNCVPTTVNAFATPATNTGTHPSSVQVCTTANSSATPAAGSDAHILSNQVSTTANASPTPATATGTHPSDNQVPTTANTSATPVESAGAPPSGGQAQHTANASTTPAQPKNLYSTSMFRNFKKPNGKKPS